MTWRHSIYYYTCIHKVALCWRGTFGVEFYTRYKRCGCTIRTKKYNMAYLRASSKRHSRKLPLARFPVACSTINTCFTNWFYFLFLLFFSFLFPTRQNSTGRPRRAVFVRTKYEFAMAIGTRLTIFKPSCNIVY